MLISAIANTGYQFLHWKVDGNIVSTVADYEFIATTDLILNATFVVITNTEVFNNDFVNVFPNPAFDMLYVNGVPEETQLIISDMHNKTVYSGHTVNGVTGLDITSLRSGLYTIRFLKEGKALNRTFMKF